MGQAEITSVQSSLVRLFTEGTMTGVGESQLLERFLAHADQAAFETIVRRHGPMVLAVCRRILSDPNDIDDAFQATFLVLVKKARSIRNHAVLGTWLHGVARRVAVRGQSDSRRRQAREHGGSDMTAWQDPRASDDDAAELWAILDEEVTRLPERYRSALVLCDLQGQTHEQAAAQLRCPVGTVKSRLARARDRLRSRLARRGIVSSAAILASALAPEPASAVTTELLASTLGAAARFLANREVAAGAVSVAIASLVDGTLRSMSMSALKSGIVILTTAGVVATGAGVFGYQDHGTRPTSNTVSLSTKTEADRKPTEDIAALAKARYSMASKTLERVRGFHKSNPNVLSLQPVHTWALRALEAQRDISDAKANQIDALEKYLYVMTEAVKAIKPENTEELAVAEYFRLEAELWLAQRGPAKSPTSPARTRRPAWRWEDRSAGNGPEVPGPSRPARRDDPDEIP